MEKWKKFHEDQFGPDTLKSPESLELGLSKMSHGGIMSINTCNSACNISSLLVEEVTKICKEKSLEKGEDPANVLIMITYFHNHLRNVWIGAITKLLSKYLDEILACDLEAIDSRYKVSTMMDAVLRSIDKEFSLPENYPKGHGDVFKHWMKKYHPRDLLLPVDRNSGPQQDLAV